MFIKIPVEFDFNADDEGGSDILTLESIKTSDPEFENIQFNLFMPNRSIRVNKNDLIKTIEYFQDHSHIGVVHLDVTMDTCIDVLKPYSFSISIEDLNKPNILSFNIIPSRRFFKINKHIIFKALKLL